MQVSVRELKARLSYYLQQSQRGQDIEVTNHRRVVARLKGVGNVASAGILALLATDATWSGGKPVGAELIAVQTGISLSELILEMRG